MAPRTRLPASDTLQRSLVVAVEEALELAGVCLAIPVILRHLGERPEPLTIVID